MLSQLAGVIIIEDITRRAYIHKKLEPNSPSLHKIKIITSPGQWGYLTANGNTSTTLPVKEREVVSRGQHAKRHQRPSATHLTTWRWELLATDIKNVLTPVYQILLQTMRADKIQMFNSDVKIRSHQKLVTPPKGGSFRQLTSCIQTW